MITLEEKIQRDNLHEFLMNTDFKVLQRIREQALDLPLSMTEEEYINLEQKRQQCVEKIREIEDKEGVIHEY